MFVAQQGERSSEFETALGGTSLEGSRLEGGPTVPPPGTTEKYPDRLYILEPKNGATKQVRDRESNAESGLAERGRGPVATYQRKGRQAGKGRQVYRKSGDGGKSDGTRRKVTAEADTSKAGEA